MWNTKGSSKILWNMEEKKRTKRLRQSLERIKMRKSHPSGIKKKRTKIIKTRPISVFTESKMERDKRKRIRKDNLNLLDKLNSIKMRKGPMNRNKFIKQVSYENSGGYRKRQLKLMSKISKKNLSFMRRIESTKSSYSLKRWKRSEKTRRRMITDLSKNARRSNHLISPTSKGSRVKSRATSRRSRTKKTTDSIRSLDKLKLLRKMIGEEELVQALADPVHRRYTPRGSYRPYKVNPIRVGGNFYHQRSYPLTPHIRTPKMAERRMQKSGDSFWSTGKTKKRFSFTVTKAKKGANKLMLRRPLTVIKKHYS